MLVMSFLVSADMLERVMAHNDQIPLSPYVFLQLLRTFITSLIRILIRESLTRFHSRSAPSISILDYLKRIIKYTNVEVRNIALDRSPETMILTPPFFFAPLLPEVLSFGHTLLHRSHLCSHAIVHTFISHMSPIRDYFYRRLQQGSLRRILHQQLVRQGGRHIRYRAERSGKRISGSNRLAIDG